jgi:diaminopimelate decarboxylase
MMAKVDVGGNTSSFGIWFEKVDEVKAVAKFVSRAAFVVNSGVISIHMCLRTATNLFDYREYNLKITKVHTHIGSGSDPEIWKLCADLTLRIAEQFPECRTVNLGGGYKVARMADEKSTDMQLIGEPVKERIREFFERTGRKLHLEIEPGSFYMVNSGSIICEVDDLVDTGNDGYKFMKVNTGMDAITRPSLYGARHPLVVVPKVLNSHFVVFSIRCACFLHETKPSLTG